MTPRSWRRASDAAGQALEMDSESRKKWLDAFEDTDEVKLTVERILQLQQDGQDFLQPFELSNSHFELQGLIADRYLIQRLLGAGGGGQAYLALDLALESRPVVLKIPHLSPALSIFVDSLRAEMRALARLQHPAIVPIYDVGLAGPNRPFLVMQFVDGLTLRQLLQEGPLDAGTAAPLILQISQAIAAAHSANILHRDIKPENMMVSTQEDGHRRAFLIDFGVARLTQETLAASNHSNLIAGTTAYMAPEQFAGNPVPASDVFSFGVTVHEMLTGRRPFPTDNCLAYFLSSNRQPPLFEDPLLSPCLRRALRQILHRDPLKRPNASEAGRILLAAIENPAHEPSRRYLLWALTPTIPVAYASWRYLSEIPPIETQIGWSRGESPYAKGFVKDPIRIFNSQAVENQRDGGISHWRVSGSDQCLNFHSFSSQQTRAAFAQGWVFQFQGRPTEGFLLATVDFGPKLGRFSIQIFLEKQGLMLRLLTGIGLQLTGPIIDLQLNPTDFHSYELAYSPSSKSASLKVNGIQIYDGYRAFFDYAEGVGVLWGTTPYNTGVAIADFVDLSWRILPA